MPAENPFIEAGQGQDAESHKMTGRLKQLAGRIRELREIAGLSIGEMAARTDTPVEEYISCENGGHDLSFAFLYRCANELGVDVTDLIEGSSPKLKTYTVTRAGHGQEIAEAHEMIYYNMAAGFQHRIADPLYVVSRYSDRACYSDIELTTHVGQELDLVISGTLKVQVGEHLEILHAGDTIYYDSSIPHGMVAADGKDCEFYAIVMRPHAVAKFAEDNAEDLDEIRRAEDDAPQSYSIGQTVKTAEEEKEGGAGREQQRTLNGVWPESSEAGGGTGDGRIAGRYIDVKEDENGQLLAIRFRNDRTFNFAYDVVDALAEALPHKTALVHVTEGGMERKLNFRDMAELSARAANYLKSLGIRRGDRVLLALKRNVQLWPVLLGLHKLGAVAVPANDQLMAEDYIYRIRKAGVMAVICTADGETADQMEEAVTAACEKSGMLRIIVNGVRPGWHCYDVESESFETEFRRPEDAAAGDDPMIMFFSSGTSGRPKLSVHSFRYPLAHYITAHYWQRVDPDGLHFAISDPGWAEFFWGMLYGQWLSEAAVFVYDFEELDAKKLLPLIPAYKVTSFSAQAAVYRALLKEDLDAYDLSSVRHASISGDTMSPEIFRRFERTTGLRIKEALGQTETALIIGSLAGGPNKIGSIGRPSPLYEVGLLDENGEAVAAGQTGEICIRIPEKAADAGGSIKLPAGLAMGYYQDPEETAAAWRDGWYHTGDLAWQDEDGFFWYMGREDELIRSSGYRIGAAEIENIIMELPFVADCGVSGVADETRGQAVRASVVLTKEKRREIREALQKETADETAGGRIRPALSGYDTEAAMLDELRSEIRSYVKEHTEPYKCPRIVAFREELPRTASGKLIRGRL